MKPLSLEDEVQKVSKPSPSSSPSPLSSSSSLSQKLIVTVYFNCRVLHGYELIRDELWTRGDKIIRPEDVNHEADVRVDCKGRILCAGFLDLQVNGAFGVDFLTYPNLLEGISLVNHRMPQYGVTGYCPTLITSPPSYFHRTLPFIKPTEPSVENGAGVLGVHVEGPFIAIEKKGAHPPECIRQFDRGWDTVEEVYGKDGIENIKLITLAPEGPNAIPVISEFVKRGIVVSLGHTVTSLNTSIDAVRRGASMITHLFNAMPAFHHRDPSLPGLLTLDQQLFLPRRASESNPLPALITKTKTKMIATKTTTTNGGEGQEAGAPEAAAAAAVNESLPSLPPLLADCVVRQSTTDGNVVFVRRPQTATTAATASSSNNNKHRDDEHPDQCTRNEEEGDGEGECDKDECGSTTATSSSGSICSSLLLSSPVGTGENSSRTRHDVNKRPGVISNLPSSSAAAYDDEDDVGDGEDEDEDDDNNCGMMEGNRMMSIASLAKRLRGAPKNGAGKNVIFFGIIADGVHTHESALRLAYKLCPSGLVLVTDSLGPAGLPDGDYFLGKQEIVVGGNPRRATVKNTNTLCGCVATLDVCVRHFLQKTNCPVGYALACVTLHPAQCMKITDRKGTLEPGTDADFVLLNDQLQVEKTYLAGKCAFNNHHSN